MRRKTVFVVNGVIFDGEGRILIEQRSEESLAEADGKWGLPGGKMEFGETPETTVVREVQEETGYEVEITGMIPLTCTSIWRYSDLELHSVVLAYWGKLLSYHKPQIPDKKVKQVRWVFPHELQYYTFLPGVIEAITYAVNHRS